MRALCVVRYIMEKVDLALVGAEGVVESGGIINKVTKVNVTEVLLLYHQRFILCFRQRVSGCLCVCVCLCL